jgi:hypothetical protein
MFSAAGEYSVSAVMPAFNSRPSIIRAIDSVLGQSSPDLLELLVVDDGSKDGTACLVAERAADDPRVRLIKRRSNGGPGTARNQALAVARGTWIAPIDADDAWHPERLSRLLALARPDVEMIFDNLMGRDAVADCATGPLFPVLPPRPVLTDLLERRAGFDLGYAKPLMRRAFLLEKSITYPKLRLSEDLLLFAEMMAAGARAVALDAPLYIYTTPVGQKSGARSGLSRSAPFDRHVAPSLEALEARYRSALTEADSAALLSRAEQMRKAEGPSLLHEARTSGAWLRFAWLLFSQAENRRLLAGRLRRGAHALLRR